MTVFRGVRTLVIVAASIGLASAASVSTALAATSIGQVKTLEGSVFILRGGEMLTATLGGRVEAKDIIRTGPNGSVGITLIDDSMISAGPSSEIALEKFRFDTTTHDGVFESKINKGTLGVISGNIAKRSEDAVKVKTPRSILGVRGTFFLVEVKE
jgi:hypothetical protein